jgi:hypothetical protein
MSKEVIEDLESKVAELASQLEKSAANHNFLVGALQQAKQILQALKEKEDASNEKQEPESVSTCEPS